MKFCHVCATELVWQTPVGEDRDRHLCPACGTVHYVNPKIVVGTIPIWQEQVLLCRRAIEPRYGFWTLPAGFMEINENTHEGALRETHEEAGAEVELLAPFCIFDVVHAQQVHIFFRANLLKPDFAAGTESLEVQLFHEQDIPWPDLAFDTVRQALTRFFADRQQGVYGLHTGDYRSPTPWPVLM